MIVKNGAQGLVMVFLILWLFFSFRYSFWVTMGLPISFLGALFLIPFMGVTINMISMVGLLIGVGLLMDDAIVIAENIAARMERGERAMQARFFSVLCRPSQRHYWCSGHWLLLLAKSVKSCA